MIGQESTKRQQCKKPSNL